MNPTGSTGSIDLSEISGSLAGSIDFPWSSVVVLWEFLNGRLF